MKVRDDEGLDAGLFGRFLIVVVEVLRVEDDTVQSRNKSLTEE